MEPRRHEDGSLYQTMIKLQGKSFRCGCGCNVFHFPDKDNSDRYECNACGAQYVSE